MANKIGHNEFISEIKNISDKVSSHILKKEEYTEFNNSNKSIVKYDIPNVGISSKDIFCELNDGKRFISIDLKKANFHALKYVNPNIVDNKNTYEEFVSQFTDNKHIIESKYIRQIIFGKLNPKRISKVEKFITYHILKSLEKIVRLPNIKFFSHDEIVIEINDNSFLYENIEKVVYESVSDFNCPVRIEYFTLKAQNPSKRIGFVKQFDNGFVEFKGCQDIFFAQAFKKYFNLPLIDNDLIYFHEGQVCKFLFPLKEKELN
jgi:hypothetical protein